MVLFLFWGVVPFPEFAVSVGLTLDLFCVFCVLALLILRFGGRSFDAPISLTIALSSSFVENLYTIRLFCYV